MQPAPAPAPTYVVPPPAPAPTPAPAPAASSAIDDLERLGKLRDAGVLTEAEFEAEKRKILG
jgi:hypothetical protein